MPVLWVKSHYNHLPGISNTFIIEKIIHSKNNIPRIGIEKIVLSVLTAGRQLRETPVKTEAKRCDPDPAPPTPAFQSAWMHSIGLESRGG